MSGGAAGAHPGSLRRVEDIELIDIVVDDEDFRRNRSERPGIKRALAMLSGHQANAIVVVKLDRLTRSVKDLGYLCDSTFGKVCRTRCSP